MGALENLLPGAVRSSGKTTDNDELVLPHSDALLAIDLADRNDIAVLGLELLEIQDDGLLVLDYSGYDSNIPEGGDWLTFTSALNQEAKRWSRGILSFPTKAIF